MWIAGGQGKEAAVTPHEMVTPRVLTVGVEREEQSRDTFWKQNRRHLRDIGS